ncbi:MAG: sporulation protein [Clostridiales bacterium]|nr:sporulation protein [Clostridiales bacterium]
MANNLGNNLDVLFSKAEELISTKTVIGEAITIGEIVLVPIIEVAVGAGAGNGIKDGGAAGMGAKITPSAIIAIIHGNVQLINIKNQNAVNKLIDMAPGVVEHLNFGEIFTKGKTKKDNKDHVVFEEEKIVE